MKRAVFIVMTVYLAFVASVVQAKVIRIGVDPTYPPFEYLKANGKLAGFDIDIGNALCAQIHVKCQWVQNSFDSIIPALKARKFDAIISSLSITKTREKQISFSDKIFNTPVHLIAPRGSALRPNAQSLEGKRVGVLQGSVFERYARKYWQPKGVQMITYGSSEAIFADLVNGRLDAALDDTIVAERSFLTKPQGENFQLVGKRVYDEVIFGPGTGIGFRKSNIQLRQRFNQAITAILHNGIYQKIAHRYFDFNVYGS
ncbi:MAG: Lysine/arginine/ornithine-binding periplasmic protein [Candidatus Celerinatantimonas neptuna]|nr:MAG: Lysine/arginine/ornithine-binding periplasmic protein [Candidatus Celerinatantimonas neptuna]